MLQDYVQPTLSPLVGLALYKACSGTWPFLNWNLKAPNDLYISNKKVAGLLIETVTQGDDIRLLVGLGLNVLATPDQVVWMDLVDGVQIQFSNGGNYRTGDYLLIPARVATGQVEWPQADDLNPQPLPPHGPEHHYALLGAVVKLRETVMVENLRCEFQPLFFCAAPTAISGRTNVIRPGVLLAKSESRAATDTPKKTAPRKKRAVKKTPGKSG